MANRHRANWSGGVDSKYYHNPDQFEKDVHEKIKQHEELGKDIENYIENKLKENPAKMDITFQCFINKLIDAKKKYNIN